MSFIYTKPLSIEGVFSKFDTDGDGKISKQEAKAAKDMDVFTNFKVKKGMTLEKFENKNRDVYAKYEQYTTRAYNKQEEKVHPDIKEMLRTLKVQEYQVIVITDGNKGAYAWDGKKYYFCPTFPSDVVSTLGAGDAFASTFCGALSRTKINVGLSLMYGSINSASVVSEFGATDGLLTFEEIEKKLKEHPDFTYLEC